MTVGAPVTMQMEISFNENPVWQGAIAGGQQTPIQLEIPAGTDMTRLLFATDLMLRRFSTNDTRRLAFAITDVQLSPVQ